ncbi:MAG: cytochrome b/b6 domain-containing protein [Rhizobiaceae bacterium]
MSITANAPKSYSTIQKSLHWLVAAIIIAQLIFGEDMAHALEAFEENADASGFSSPIVLFHIWGGLSIILFAVWRLFLRKAQGVPQQPAEEPAYLKFAASATHVLFYALLFMAPISGAVAYYLGVEAAGEFHQLLKPVFIVLIAAHVVGALYQHFWLKTDVLKRMTYG